MHRIPCYKLGFNAIFAEQCPLILRDLVLFEFDMIRKSYINFVVSRDQLDFFGFLLDSSAHEEMSTKIRSAWRN